MLLSRAFLLAGLCLLAACTNMQVQTVGELLRQQDVGINVAADMPDGPAPITITSKISLFSGDFTTFSVAIFVSK